QAIYTILNRQTPLVVILPTGGGKSLLFTIPAYIEKNRVIVVIVLYQALITDLVERI
ncbi:hypothetical protein BKA66DRAFT_435487, partial [Pyrenochaeta sp. MPI-SDFR-AT-0127]